VVDELYPPPPWRWDQRAALWRYWVRDPVEAVKDIVPHHLMRLLPSQLVSDIGARLGRRAGRRAKVASRRARETLRLLRPDASEAEIEALLAAHWEHVGRCFAEFSAQYRFLPEGRVEVAGAEIPLGIVASGRPLIVAGTHVGNWEMVHAALSKIELPFHGIFQALPNRFRMRIAFNMRNFGRRFGGSQTAQPILPTLAAPFQALRLLETREAALLYYVDENWEGRVHAPALGRPLRMEGNIMRAVRLAQHTGAAIVLAHCERLGPGPNFRVVFGPEVELGPPGRGRAGIMEDIGRVDAAVEALVRARPEHWLMLHAFRADR
jgi:KDO2-lipid IV(A) lauroyltransferase